MIGFLLVSVDVIGFSFFLLVYSQVWLFCSCLLLCLLLLLFGLLVVSGLQPICLCSAVVTCPTPHLYTGIWVINNCFQVKKK